VAIVSPLESVAGMEVRGHFGRSLNVGRMRLGYNYVGADVPSFGIYSRKVYGQGVTLKPSKRGDRWGLSRMVFYRPTNPQTVPQQAWRAVFAEAISTWRGLTDLERASYSKKARTRGMSGYNLFISNWLQSRRA